MLRPCFDCTGLYLSVVFQNGAWFGPILVRLISKYCTALARVFTCQMNRYATHKVKLHKLFLSSALNGQYSRRFLFSGQCWGQLKKQVKMCYLDIF